MAEIYEMDRQELRNILMVLYENFNQYAKLYTLVAGDVYIHEAYGKIAEKFGRNVDDYESQVTDGSEEESQKISAARAQSESATKRYNKLNRKVEFESSLTKGGTADMKQMALGAVGIGVVCWIIYFFFPLAIIGTFVAIWFGIKLLQATALDKHIAQLEDAKNVADSSLQQFEKILTDAESEKWAADFEVFCAKPENQKLVDQAKVITEQRLNELNTIDFSNYALLPFNYQDNMSVQKSLELLAAGRANNWQDCVQIIEQERVQQRQFSEMQRQTKNQEQIISNQEQMINNQEQQLDRPDVLNENVQAINASVVNLATKIEKQGAAVNRHLDVVAANQGLQMFQQKKFHKEQLEEMRASCKVMAYGTGAYMNPYYYQHYLQRG